MIYSFAPMEGVTTGVFRRTHARFFPGTDRYAAPFLAPDGQGRVKASALADLDPEKNGGLPLLPQILCNRAAAFLALSRELAAMGYTEVNLNAGCPSATVVPKHKGAGMLLDLRSLDAFLGEVFEYAAIRVSVKSRLGLESPEEFPAILEIYNRYPLSELILHARDRKGLYQSRPDLHSFAKAFADSRAPLCYNGNILSPAHRDRVLEAVPGLERIMVGRGAAANPALIRQLRGGPALEADEFAAFLEALFAETLASGIGEYHSLGRMKELWFYSAHLFPGANREIKRINKARSAADYRAAVDALFATGRFDPGACFPGALPE
jgi:tRNA-dihydrouridine synthase